MPTIRETIRKAREFSELPEGWHFGDGVPPSRQRVDQAIAFLEFADLAGIERANAFPGIRGQIEITFYTADRMVEITIESDDSITMAEDRGREQIYFEENRSRFDVYRRLEEFSQNTWPSSDLFTVNTMTQNVRVPVLRVALSTSEPENRFPLSIVSAREPRAAQFVLILRDITTSNLGTPKFTGQSETPTFRPSVGSRWRGLLVGTIATGTFMVGQERPPAGLLRR